MMNHFRKIGLVLLVALTAFSAKNHAPSGVKRYSVAELQSDFQFLRRKLEKHPGIYRYTPQPAFDRFLDSLYATISGPGTGMEFYNKIASIYPKLCDGHTYFLPNADETAIFNAHEKFFPPDVYVLDGRMYLIRSCAKNCPVPAGAELLRINGCAADRLMDTLMSRQIRDGKNDSYASWILNRWFREYYSYSFGHPAQFEIEFRVPGDTQVRTQTIGALPKDSIRYYRAQNYPQRPEPAGGIAFRIDSAAATLTIASFDDQVLKQGQQHFKTTVSLFFTKLRASNVHSLVLDLRDNQGGDPANGKLLLSFLLDTSFLLVREGPAAGTTRPVKQPFRGTVYCLVNGGSFSVTGMVASCLAAHHRAIFIGQETGGNATVLSGSAGHFHLPNTHIYCEVSRRTWLLADRPNDGRGTRPDYTVVPAVDDLVAGYDTEKNFAYQLIRDKK